MDVSYMTGVLGLCVLGLSIFFFFFFFCGSIDLARTLDMGTGLMILKPREHY